MSRYQQFCLQHYIGHHGTLYFFFCFSVVIDNAKPICLDCVDCNVCSCILLLLKLHGTFCVVHTWYYHSLALWDMRIYLIFDLINLTIPTLYTCLILLIQLGYENWYCFPIKFDVEKEWIICRNFVAGIARFLWVY